MNTVISVKVEKEVKEAAKEVANSAGLSLSSLINSYLRQVVATRRIELYSPEPTTPKLDKLIAAVEAEIDAGKVSQRYTDPEAFVAALKK